MPKPFFQGDGQQNLTNTLPYIKYKFVGCRYEGRLTRKKKKVKVEESTVKTEFSM